MRLRSKVGWLETLLYLAGLALLLQLFPGLWIRFWEKATAILDPRSWSQVSWIVANLVIVLALVSVRFAPNFKSGVHEAYTRLRRRTQRKAPKDLQTEHDERLRRDKEWCERAANRRPFQ
jgi:hypothetical protein